MDDWIGVEERGDCSHSSPAKTSPDWRYERFADWGPPSASQTRGQRSRRAVGLSEALPPGRGRAPQVDSHVWTLGSTISCKLTSGPQGGSTAQPFPGRSPGSPSPGKGHQGTPGTPEKDNSPNTEYSAIQPPLPKRGISLHLRPAGTQSCLSRGAARFPCSWARYALCARARAHTHTHSHTHTQVYVFFQLPLQDCQLSEISIRSLSRDWAWGYREERKRPCVCAGPARCQAIPGFCLSWFLVCALWVAALACCAGGSRLSEAPEGAQ
ncbi:uncharacterized protein LOC116269816 [Papio anubis]|uniref:uncharacterized protein LOC116269816 n=1 Tax=Papio anubis TaxID=9555 RepID=UPI0012AE8F65|nr:uncharacterized protein LOC116269816 [Papio anubis]